MPLLIQVREYNHTYVLTAEYRSDMYSQAFIDGILDSYEAAMSSMLKTKYVSEISVISQSGVNKIAEFNHTENEFDRSKTISDMFAELAETIPDHTAVVFKDRQGGCSLHSDPPLRIHGHRTNGRDQSRCGIPAS